ncbi:MAG: hypothetical protein WCR30_01070 [Clostridia bacterium]
MKVEKVKKICAICGKENFYNQVVSFSNQGKSDFDLREPQSLLSDGSLIQECPECHYCSYDISKLVEQSYYYEMYKKEKWINNFESIFKNESNNAVRKYLIMAKQFHNNSQFLDEFKMLIGASWACEDDKEKSNKLKNEAIDLYFKEILKNRRTQLMQLSDLARQVEKFDIAKDLITASSLLTNENDKDYEFIKKVIDYESKFILNKDSKRHNLSEIK